MHLEQKTSGRATQQGTQGHYGRKRARMAQNMPEACGLQLQLLGSEGKGLHGVEDQRWQLGEAQSSVQRGRPGRR